MMPSAINCEKRNNRQPPISVKTAVSTACVKTATTLTENYTETFCLFDLGGTQKTSPLPISFAADELFDAAVSFVVAHLDGRMFGEIGGGRVKDTTDAAIERKFAATNGVDRDAGRVG